MTSVMDDVADLVLTPFREIVDKGKTAVVNAGETQPMLKAAQTLVKEGERALKRIEPICKKNLDEYGPSFLAALKENDEIATYRAELTEMLWEFDDYVEVDDFDESKFTELKGLSRKAAPKIYDMLMRMKLEVKTPTSEAQNYMTQFSPPSSPPMSLNSAVIRDSSSFSVRSSSQPGSPKLPPPNIPLPPIPNISPARLNRASVASSHASGRSRRDSLQSRGIEDGVSPVSRMNMYRISHGTTTSNEMAMSEAGHSTRSESPKDQPPPLPTSNPWDFNVQSHSPSEENGRPEFEPPRPIVTSDESPILPFSHSPGENDRRSPPDYERRTPKMVPRPLTARSSFRSDMSSQDGDDRRRQLSNPSLAGPTYNLFPGQVPRSKPSTLSPTISQAIPEENAIGVVPALPAYTPAPTSASLSPHSSLRLGHPALQRGVPPMSSSSSDNRSSTATSEHPTTNPPSPTSSYTAPKSTTSNDAPAPELAPHQVDHGLIPLDTEPSSPAPFLPVVTRDKTIGSESSFHAHKGFCEGAKEVLRGGIGVKKTKKPIGLTSTAIIARCSSCLYELDFSQLENDVNRSDKGKFTTAGVEFRIRFLQKSHVAIKRLDDIMYSCIFCVQAGQTLEESDSTVFFSAKSLLNHVARHPRPLPQVPGVVVVETPDVPPHLHNDFDIHLINPPRPHPAAEKAAYIASQPSGIALHHSRKLYGQRIPEDRSTVLELAVGGRVTGLSWPEHWEGTFCHGWHDGIFAAVCMDVLRLEPPPTGQVRLGGMSTVRGRARWKFSPAKDKTKGADWLKFDRGEIITNINWVNPEHWCWSGTNAKGKWGIFPQAFLEPESLTELTQAGSDRASILSTEKNKSQGLMSRFTSRKHSGRPPSVAGSMSSGDSFPYR